MILIKMGSHLSTKAQRESAIKTPCSAVVHFFVLLCLYGRLRPAQLFAVCDFSRVQASCYQSTKFAASVDGL